MDTYIEKLHNTADFLKCNLGIEPQLGIILGSGWGSLVNEIENLVEIDYKDIPNFPMTTVDGHHGKLIAGILYGKNVLIMKGRFHYYEGYEISQITFHIRVFRLLGIKDIILTNAAGGLNNEFKPGDLMIIEDHIGFFASSPLRGSNIDEFGVRFPDMSNVYNKELIKIALKTSRDHALNVRKGVYAFTQGPMYETPAEIKALRIVGADAVGMSTVPEAIIAKHANMRILGVSCITNMAAGILNETLNHNEVLKVVQESEKRFKIFIKGIIQRWPEVS